MNKDPRLTDTQKVLFALPTLTLIFLILLILLNKKSGAVQVYIYHLHYQLFIYIITTPSLDYKIKYKCI